MNTEQFLLPKELVEKLAEDIKKKLQICGAKFYLIIKNANWEPVCRCMYRTDKDINYDTPLEDLNWTKAGLAKEIIRRKTWLLIPQVSSNKASVQRCLVGKYNQPLEDFEEIGVLPRLESDFTNDPDSDPEISLLYIPILKNDRVIGLVGVWRQKDQRPLSVKDVSLLLNTFGTRFDPLFAHMISLWENKREQSFYTGLLDKFEKKLSVTTIYQRMLKEVLKYSGALSVLLYEKNEFTGETAYIIAQRSYESTQALSTSAIDKHFPTHCDASKLERKISSLPYLASNHIEFRSIVSHSGEQNHSWYLVLLDDSRRTDKSLLPTHLDGNNDVLSNLFSMAYKQFEGYINSHIRHWVLKLQELSCQNQDELLQITSNVIYEAIGCDALLTYVKDKSPRVFHVCPDTKSDLGKLSVEKKSLTHKVMRSGSAEFVFDMNATYPTRPKTDHNQLKTVRQMLGLPSVRSWFACPITPPKENKNTVYGLFKLLTKKSCLSWAHLRITKAIAHRTYLYYHQLNEKNVLDSINEISHQLVGIQGEQLNIELTQRFTNWLHENVREDCDYVIVAGMKSITSSTGTVLFFTESKSINELTSDEYLFASSKLQEHHGSKTGKEPWFYRNRTKPISFGSNYHCYHSSLGVPGDDTFFGRLFIFSTREFAPHLHHFFDNAARELGAVLYQEKLRRQWSAATGRYRHAIIGPIMGIESLADGILEELSTLDIENKMISDSHRHMAEEVSLIRNWRSYQRLLAESINVVTKIRELKPYVDRWLKRVESVKKTRNISIKQTWKETSSQCEFDDTAMDIVFSNLIENALKYSPEGSEVELRVYRDPTYLIIELANEGPKLSDKLLDEILKEGVRGEMEAMQRIVPGQGIGLPLAKALVEAHEMAKFEIFSRDNYRRDRLEPQKNRDAIITVRIQLLHRRRKGDK